MGFGKPGKKQGQNRFVCVLDVWFCGCTPGGDGRLTLLRFICACMSMCVQASRYGVSKRWKRNHGRRNSMDSFTPAIVTLFLRYAVLNKTASSHRIGCAHFGCRTCHLYVCVHVCLCGILSASLTRRATNSSLTFTFGLATSAVRYGISHALYVV